MKKKKESIASPESTEVAETVVETPVVLTAEQEKKKLRNEITHQLRFIILERDGYTCRYCGQTPLKDKNIQLVVDHIKPLDAGGGNDEDNLVTACFECNEGKKQKRLAVNPFNADDPDNVKELLDNDMHDLVDADSLVETETVGTKDAIKKYFLTDVSKKNRDALYAYYSEEDSGCPHDCEMCVDVDDKFMSCFVYLRKWAGRDVKIEERVKGNIFDGVKMQCDTCYLVGRCPKYKVAASCAFDFGVDTDFTDTKSAMKMLVNLQKERVMRGFFFEKVDGGALDKNVSSELAVLQNLIAQITDAGQPSLKFEAKGAGGLSVFQQILTAAMNPKQLPPTKEVKQIESAEDAVVTPVPDPFSDEKV